MTLHFPKSNQFFYDTSLPTTLQVDASKSGLGVYLMQQGQPVAYACVMERRASGGAAIDIPQYI